MHFAITSPVCSLPVGTFVCLFVFIFGFVGSLLLRVGFLQLQRVGATLGCGAWASHCGGLLWSMGSRHAGFSSCRAGSVAVARELQSAGSVVVAHGLSCSAACGIFLDQGSNPCPLHWQCCVLNQVGESSGAFLMHSLHTFLFQEGETKPEDYTRCPRQ